MSFASKATFAWIALACVATVVILALAGQPPGRFLWSLSPYLPLVALGVVAHAQRVARSFVLAVTVCISGLAVLELLDGLLLHSGWIIEDDPQVAHLVTFFAPLHQWVLTIISSLMVLLIRIASLLVTRKRAR